MKHTTPLSLNPNVYLLRKTIGLETEPVFVPVLPEPFYKSNHCFQNVAAKIEKNGGSMQHGWMVWETPNKLIEGEFHAVWVSADGELVDVTPKPDGEKKILFIPDPIRIWDKKPVPSFRLALCDEPAIRKGIEHAEWVEKLRDEYNDGTGFPKIPLDVLQAGPHQNQTRPVIATGRNEKCPCGSGLKYKKCHGRAGRGLDDSE